MRSCTEDDLVPVPQRSPSMVESAASASYELQVEIHAFRAVISDCQGNRSCQEPEDYYVRLHIWLITLAKNHM